MKKESMILQGDSKYIAHALVMYSLQQWKLITIKKVIGTFELIMEREIDE